MEIGISFMVVVLVLKNGCSLLKYNEFNPFNTLADEQQVTADKQPRVHYQVPSKMPIFIVLIL
jgi:hypothetical protein